MIIVHHLENSRSQRVLWLLEELEMPYDIRRYERDRKTMLAPTELKRVHPLGKAPVIEDDGRVLAETGAIVEYLVEKAGGKLGPPPNREAVLRYRHFLHYAEGSMMPPLFGLLIINRLGLLGKPAKATVQAMLDTHLDWLESELAARAWFAGDEFTAADIMMSFPLEASRARGGLGPSRPHLMDWLERIHARPAYGAALGKGGPYAYA
ncbi:glutathione S-transferase family protein [Sphingosinicella humi]|uniref:glutathione transferase n=1 Tax=Allosphingosinicella humi TaxID=2068657 RepID=A0A2U2IYM0_9SPHN|nr:glutathione S-transferase [Sphingosinicella humi]PWG01193.1 glutathione S-transferase [Sphingosinicella humi]